VQNNQLAVDIIYQDRRAIRELEILIQLGQHYVTRKNTELESVLEWRERGHGIAAIRDKVTKKESRGRLRYSALFSMKNSLHF
jgi:hypothetical protein